MSVDSVLGKVIGGDRHHSASVCDVAYPLRVLDFEIRELLLAGKD